MIYSITCEYAIRALAWLSRRPKGSLSAIARVHRETGVPRAYVAKVFQGLGRAGVVGSRSGPNGGYFLKKDPKKLTLLDVVRIMDDPARSPLSNCVMGRSDCSDRNPCCLHDDWAKAREAIFRRLSSQTVADAYEPRKIKYRNHKQEGVLSGRMQSVFGYQRSEETL